MADVHVGFNEHGMKEGGRGSETANVDHRVVGGVGKGTAIDIEILFEGGFIATINLPFCTGISLL